MSCKVVEEQGNTSTFISTINQRILAIGNWQLASARICFIFFFSGRWRGKSLRIVQNHCTSLLAGPLRDAGRKTTTMTAKYHEAEVKHATNCKTLWYSDGRMCLDSSWARQLDSHRSPQVPTDTTVDCSDEWRMSPFPMSHMLKSSPRHTFVHLFFNDTTKTSLSRVSGLKNLTLEF